MTATDAVLNKQLSLPEQYSVFPHTTHCCVFSLSALLCEKPKQNNAIHCFWLSGLFLFIHRAYIKLYNKNYIKNLNQNENQIQRKILCETIKCEMPDVRVGTTTQSAIGNRQIAWQHTSWPAQSFDCDRNTTSDPPPEIDRQSAIGDREKTW